MLMCLRVQAKDDVSFDPRAPPSAFQNEKVADMFFRTKDCLRTDPSTCVGTDSPFYQVTHLGLDALMQRFMDEARIFTDLPDTLALGNHSA
jgi:hypothetical protein